MPIRILVIEDDPVLNDQLAALLRQNGYITDQCHGGERGLEIASRQEHELILLDVMLPERDGFSLLAVLRLEGLEVDRLRRHASAHGRLLDLTPIQFKLLWLLLLNRDEVLSKAYLSQAVLKRSLGVHDRGIDMHLSRVRRKLKDAGWQGERLQTIHGRGYCLA